jgi:small subunit ribosomal protein S12
MSTVHQLIFKPRIKKKKKKRAKALKGNPMLWARCIKVYITTPRKPNSAKRKIAKVTLSTGKNILISIPGRNHGLQKYSKVLVRGGNTRDIPGVKYRAIRGKYDLKPWYEKRQKRSKYGVKNIDLVKYSNEI